MQRLFAVLLLCLVRCNASATRKRSNWWFQTHTPEYTSQAVDIITTYRASITGVYIYCGFSINANGTFASPSDADIMQKTAPFLAMNLDVGIALGVDQAAIESGIASAGVAAATATAKRNNITSLMVDYEPHTNTTHSHAVSYAHFISDLSSALHAQGVQCGMCVSSWSILTEFGLYSKTGVDQVMSMASTYFGKNVTSNKRWVSQELDAGVSLSQLHVGIGSTNSIAQKWNYQWTESGFNSFLLWLEQRHVQNIDIWRTDIDTLNATNGTAQWIYDGIASFLSGKDETESTIVI